MSIPLLVVFILDEMVEVGWTMGEGYWDEGSGLVVVSNLGVPNERCIRLVEYLADRFILLKSSHSLEHTSELVYLIHAESFRPAIGVR